MDIATPSPRLHVTYNFLFDCWRIDINYGERCVANKMCADVGNAYGMHKHHKYTSYEEASLQAWEFRLS